MPLQEARTEGSTTGLRARSDGIRMRTVRRTQERMAVTSSLQRCRVVELAALLVAARGYVAARPLAPTRARIGSVVKLTFDELELWRPGGERRGADR